MLPPEVTARVLGENVVIGLKLSDGTAPRIYYLRTVTKEGPSNLRDFALSAASAMNTAGSGWDAIQNASNANQLEPADAGVLHQMFWGVNPSYVRVYLQYPGNVFRRALRGTPTVGGDVGFIDGRLSGYLHPGVESELFTVKDLNPNFNGYHPYAEPATVTPRLNFFIFRFQTEFLGITDDKMLPVNGQKPPAPADIARARVVTIGGISPTIGAPSWLTDLVT